MKKRVRFRRFHSMAVWLKVFGLFLVLVLFQNCSNSFEISDQLKTSPVSLSSRDATTATPPVSTPSATPSPAQTDDHRTSTLATISKTNFYFGGAGAVQGLQLDHKSGTVSPLPQAAITGENVGWLAFDSSSQTIFAADSGSSSTLQSFSYDSNSGALVPKKIFNFLARVVHFSLVGQPLQLFASSWDDGVLGAYQLDANQSTMMNTQQIDFTNAARTHSSTFDSKRNLLFVANFGLNKISVYHLESGQLSAITEIPAQSPRTVVYDSLYDKIYYTTEMYTGPSYIQALTISGAGANLTFATAGSLAIPMVGADLKVNHAYHYVMATARESGKESIWAMPITSSGNIDSSRAAFSINVGSVQPRSLEISADGNYAMVAMNSYGDQNVVLFKLNFDANSKFTSSDKIYSAKIGTSGFMCSLSVAVP